MTVGTHVRILDGMWEGREGKIREVIVSVDTDVRYDVDCAPGRWYYAEELTVIVEAKQ